MTGARSQIIAAAAAISAFILAAAPAAAQTAGGAELPTVTIRPGGDRNVTNFDYVPPDQPRRRYQTPDPGAAPTDIEFETVKERILRLEENVEKLERQLRLQQNEIDDLRAKREAKGN
jgi:hypothetical protein